MRTIVTIALAFCALGAAITAAAQHNVDPVRIVQQKFQAFNNHDVTAIEHIYAADATLRSPDYPELSGNARIADTYRRIFDAIPDAKDDIEHIDRAADRVYVQFLLTGHLKNVEKPISVPIISVYTVRHGSIVADTTYYDRKAP